METYRVGLIGLSGIAAGPPDAAFHPSLGTQMPHSHAASYGTFPEARVVAVCDLKPDLIDRFMANWGDRWPGVRGYAGHREMLDAEQLDVVSVATPDHLHAQVIVDACAAGVKGIFCEKPLATTVADADRIVEAVERRGVVMSVNHWTRWRPATLHAREALRAGTIGTLKRIVQTGGGKRAMMFRNGTYAADYLCYFADSDPVEVFAQLDDEFRGYGPRYAGDGGHAPSSDPGYTAYIRFANGVRGLLNFSQGTVEFWETFLMGETGWVRFGNEVPLEIATRPDPRQPTQRVLVPPDQFTRTGTVANMGEFFHALEHGGQTSSPPREARRSVEIMVAALQSAHLGAPVKLPVDEENPRPEGRGRPA